MVPGRCKIVAAQKSLVERTAAGAASVRRTRLESDDDDDADREVGSNSHALTYCSRDTVSGNSWTERDKTTLPS